MADSAFTFYWYYIYKRDPTTEVWIYSCGIILNTLSHGLLYGYMGYLMTNLSAPEDPLRSQNVVSLLQKGSSFNIEDDLYQAKGLETIKVIIGQFLRMRLTVRSSGKRPARMSCSPLRRLSNTALQERVNLLTEII
jgi:hypothetical protein